MNGNGAYRSGRGAGSHQAPPHQSMSTNKYYGGGGAAATSSGDNYDYTSYGSPQQQLQTTPPSHQHQHQHRHGPMSTTNQQNYHGGNNNNNNNFDDRFGGYTPSTTGDVSPHNHNNHNNHNHHNMAMGQNEHHNHNHHVVTAQQHYDTSMPDPLADFDNYGIQDVQSTASRSVASPTGVTSSVVGGEELPPGGKFYEAKIYTPTLGVMFFKPQELTDSLFLQTEKEVVEALGDRPVTAYIVEGSSARNAGVELGHVLTKVNGIDVKNPKEASRLIKEGPRPLPLQFYQPDTTVVVAEGEHMVKYDTKTTAAPKSAKEWKPKYVVVGGIIAQPWVINMYRSKAEYDIAVIETQARQSVSVKVKRFDLQMAKLENDWQGPQICKYKNKLHPWKYFVVIPANGNPIKISSPNHTQLKPVHEGIRRVLLSQQRGGGDDRALSNNDPSAPTIRIQQRQQPPRLQDQYNAPQRSEHSSEGGSSRRNRSRGFETF